MGCKWVPGQGAAAPPLQGVERLGDATGDGHDEAGDEDDPVEDHVVLGAVALLLLLPRRLRELLLQRLYSILIVLAARVYKPVHDGHLEVRVRVRDS